MTCCKSQDELWRVSTHLFFSFNKYILRASYVPGGVVDAEIRARSKPGKSPCPFMERTWRRKQPPPWGSSGYLIFMSLKASNPEKAVEEHLTQPRTLATLHVSTEASKAKA